MTCTSATCVRRCSRGRWPAVTAARSCLRVEDTDRSRVSDEAYARRSDVLRLDGHRLGRGAGGRRVRTRPYRQSERLPSTPKLPSELRAAGAAYPCYCTPAELARAPRTGPRREPSAWLRRSLPHADRRRSAPPSRPRDARACCASGCRDGTTTWNDLVRGEITIDHANVPDFAITRSDGHPLYLLAAGRRRRGDGPDAHRARRGPGDGDPAAAGAVRGARASAGALAGVRASPADHRRGQRAAVQAQRRGVDRLVPASHGFLPEALANYLALLGWSPGGDREFFGADVLLDGVRRATASAATPRASTSRSLRR